MSFVQIGFIASRTPYSGTTYSCITNIPGGKYFVEIVAITTTGVNQTSAAGADMISRGIRIASNQFYFEDRIGNMGHNDWIIGNTCDVHRYWGTLKGMMTFTGQPITFTISNYYFSGFVAQSNLPHVIFNCYITPIDEMSKIEKPIYVPNITRLMVLNNTNYTSVRTIQIPVNANGRYRCRVVGITTMFSNPAGGGTSTSATNNYLLSVYSRALNNFGITGGAGYLYNTRDLDTSMFSARQPEYFVSDTIANYIDITMRSTQNLASMDLAYMIMIIEMIPIEDRK